MGRGQVGSGSPRHPPAAGTLKACALGGRPKPRRPGGDATAHPLSLRAAANAWGLRILSVGIGHSPGSSTRGVLAGKGGWEMWEPWCHLSKWGPL